MVPTPEGKQSIMRLAQRMVSNFCLSVGTSNSTRSTVVSGLDAFGIRVTSYKSQHEPNGMVLCAATSFWLPVSPQNVFNFLKDERTRPQVLVHALKIMLCNIFSVIICFFDLVL